MPTKLSDLPDELVSIIIEHLVNSVSPEWPHLDRYHQRCWQNYREALTALASTCRRMLSLCSSLARKLKGQLPPALARGVWEWSEVDRAAYPSPPLTGHAMTHLQILLSAPATSADFRASAALVLRSPHLHHLSVVFNGHGIGHTANQNLFLNILLSSRDPEDTSASQGPSTVVAQGERRRCKNLKSVHFQASTFAETARPLFLFIATFRIEDLVIITRPGLLHQCFDKGRRTTRLPAMRSVRYRYTFHTTERIKSQGLTEFGETNTIIPSHIEEVWLPESAGGGGPQSLLEPLPACLNRLMLGCHIEDAQGGYNNMKDVGNGYTLGEYVATKAGAKGGSQQTALTPEIVSIKAAEIGQDLSRMDTSVFDPTHWKRGLLDWIGNYFDDSWKQYLELDQSAHVVDADAGTTN